MENRLQNLEDKLDQFILKTENGNVALSKDMEYLKLGVLEIKDLLTKNYVTRLEFDPIKRLTYGAVTMILVAFLGAIISITIPK